MISPARAAPLALLFLFADAHAAAPAPDWKAAERTEIIFSNFAFTPATVHLQPGRPYLLHFVNRGSGGHDFAAPAFFAAATIRPEDAGAIRGGKVALGKGESRDVALVPTAGRWKVKCTHFLHSALGMKGVVVVD